MTDTTPIPDDLREAAMALALRRYARDDAGASVTLSDAFDEDHPEDGGNEDADLDRYFEEEWAPARLQEAWDELGDLLAAGSVTVWRNVCIPGDPLRGFADHYRDKGWVGIFWTHERDAAHAHDGPQGVPGVLVEGRVEASSIDWVHTLASYAHPDWVGEEEIRLLPGGEVELVSMTLREGWLRRTAHDPCVPVDIGSWAGMRLKAGDPTMAPRAEFETDEPTAAFAR